MSKPQLPELGSLSATSVPITSTEPVTSDSATNARDSGGILGSAMETGGNQGAEAESILNEVVTQVEGQVTVLDATSTDARETELMDTGEPVQVDVRSLLAEGQRLKEAHLSRVVLGVLENVLQAKENEDMVLEAENRNAGASYEQLRDSELPNEGLPSGPLGGKQVVGLSDAEPRNLVVGAERSAYETFQETHPAVPHSANVQDPGRYTRQYGKEEGHGSRYHSQDPIELQIRIQQREHAGVTDSPMSYAPQELRKVPEARGDKEESYLKQLTSVLERGMVAAVGYAAGLQQMNPVNRKRQTRSTVSGTSSHRSKASHRELSANQKCGTYVSSLPSSTVGNPETNAPVKEKERSNMELRAPFAKGLSKEDIALDAELRGKARNGRSEEDGQSISWSDSRNEANDASNESETSHGHSLRSAKRHKEKGSTHSQHAERSSRPRSRRSSGASTSFVGSVARSSVTGISKSASQWTTASQQQNFMDKFYETVGGRLSDKDAAIAREQKIAEEKQQLAEAQVVREKETAKQQVAREQKIADAQVAREKETAQERIAREAKITETLVAREKEVAKQIQDSLRKDRSLERSQAAAALAREQAISDRNQQEAETQRSSVQKMLAVYHEQNEEAKALLKEKCQALERAQQETLEKKNRELEEAEKEKQAALKRKEDELLEKVSQMQARIDEYRLSMDQRQQEQDRRVAQHMNDDQLFQQRNDELHEKSNKAQSKLEVFEKKLTKNIDSNPATQQLHADLIKDALEARQNWQEHTKLKQESGGQFHVQIQRFGEEREAMSLQIAVLQSKLEETNARCAKLQRSRSCSQTEVRSSSEPAPPQKERHRVSKGRGDLEKGVRFENVPSESGDEEGQGALRTCPGDFKPYLMRTDADTGVKLLGIDGITIKRLQPDVPSSSNAARKPEERSTSAVGRANPIMKKYTADVKRIFDDTMKHQKGEMDVLNKKISQMSAQEHKYKATILQLQTEMDDRVQQSLMVAKTELETQQAELIAQLRRYLVDELRQVKAGQTTLVSSIEAIKGQLTPQGASSPCGRQSPTKFKLPPGRLIDNNVLSSDAESPPPSEHSGGNLSLAKMSVVTESAPVVVNNHPRISLNVLKEYDGTGSFSSWLISFERMMDLHDHMKSETERVKYLPIRLTGTAQDYFNSLSKDKQTNYKKAVKALSGTFAELSRVEYTKWMRMTQRQNESVIEYATRMRRAQQEVVEDEYDDENMQRMLLRCFIDGLDPQIRFKLNDLNVKTWDEALEQALYYEKTYKKHGVDPQRHPISRPYNREARLHVISEVDETPYLPQDSLHVATVSDEDFVPRSEFETVQRDLAALRLDSQRKNKPNKPQKAANVSMMDSYGKPIVSTSTQYSADQYNQRQQDIATARVAAQQAESKLYVPPQARPENPQGATAPIPTQGYTRSPNYEEPKWVPDRAWRKRVEADKGNNNRGGAKNKNYNGLPGDRWDNGIPLCNHCRESGHIARECNKLPPDGQDDQRKQREAIKREMQKAVQLAAISAGATDEALEPFFNNAAPVRIRPTGSRMYIDTQVNGVMTSALVDTGAEATVLDEEFADKCIDPTKLFKNRTKCTSATGHQMPIVGSALVEITVGTVTRTHMVLIAKKLFRDMVLGDEFFATLNTDMCYRQSGGKTYRQLYVEGQPVVTKTGNPHRGVGSVCEISFEQRRKIPTRSVSYVMVKVKQRGRIAPDVKNGDLVLIEPIAGRETGVQVPRVITRVQKGTVIIPVMNVADVPVTLPTEDYALRIERFKPKVTDIEEIEPSIPKGITKPEDLATLQSVKISKIMRVVEERMAKHDEVPVIPGLDLSKSDLTEEQKKRYMFALDCIRDVFAINDADLGQTDLVQHDIDTGDAVPIRQRLYRVPFHNRKEMDQLLDDMLATGVIEPANSPLASPVVLVRKKDGKLRFCVDYRKVNAVTRKDSYPLPRIDELLDALNDGSYFTTIDLQSGFWQIPMTKDARRKTTFVCHRGSFNFVKMPFGLTAAPGTFQRLMDCILSGLAGYICLIFLDDVIIYTQTTVEQHLEDLLKVLIALAYYGLKVKGKKCHIAKKELQFLGHIVSAKGIHPDPEKISAIRDCTPPKDQHELRVFLGLVGFYRKFIFRCARITAPLTKLLQKDVEFIWTEQCQEAFNALKKHLTEAPILAYPDLQKPYTDLHIRVVH